VPRRLVPAAIALGLAAGPPAAAAGAVPGVIRTGGPSAPSDPKVAVVASGHRLAGHRFRVTGHGHTVLRGRLKAAPGSAAPWRHAATADVTRLHRPGRYTVHAAGLRSRSWRVVRSGRSRLVHRLLRVFAVNSDGDERNPVFGPAHLDDAIVRGGPLDGQRIDLVGGWRDAGDDLKIAQPTAMAVSYLNLAARLDPADARALHRASDVGVRWLLKLHPAPDVWIGLVGDDRDHETGFRDPADDDADPRQGVGVRYAYPSDGSNVAGSVAAALALSAARSSGAPRDELLAAARAWYDHGRAVDALRPITDPNVSDYYPDDIFTDDLAFAAIELYRATGEDHYLDEAGTEFARGADDPQVYAGTTVGSVGPIAAAELCGGLGARTPAGPVRHAGCAGVRKVLSAARERYRDTAFGSPGIFTFGWVQDDGGTGAVAAAARRAGVVKDGRRIAAGARDYLLGRNPWGRSFVVGPGPTEAKNPHHAAYLKGRPAKLLDGAVVGGPADPGSITESGLHLRRSPLRRFDSRRVVYEDRRADFVTSEVGLAYSASAVLLAASLGR
jgi:endoglucanase